MLRRLALVFLLVGAGGASASPAPLVIGQPFDVVAVGGSYAVSDFLYGSVYLIDAKTGAHRVLVRLPYARELEMLDARTILVSSREKIYRVEVRTRAARLVRAARDDVLGFAHGTANDLYVSEKGERVVHILADGTRKVLIGGRNGIHGVTLAGGRLIACESYAGNVLSIDLRSGRLQTLARKLSNPSSAVVVRGGMYLSEFTGGRIVFRTDAGTIRTVAMLPQVGPLSLAPEGRLLAVTLAGEVVAVDPKTGAKRSLLP